MEKKEIKINGKIAVEIKINGGLFWKAGGSVEGFKLDEDGYLIGADGKYYERWYDDSHIVDNNPIADLNGQWVEDTVSGSLNIDKNFDYFMSNSNYHVSNSYSQFKVSWSGLTHIDFLYRSYGESNYDYLVINGLDKDKFTSKPSNNTSGILAHTYSKPTTTYNTLSIDCDEGEHFIWFCYIKDISGDTNSDRAFVGIPNIYKSGIIEKQGEELHYQYVKGYDYIIPREGYIQFKYYKTYYSPNGLNAFRTDEYVLGEEIPATPITKNYLRFDATTNDVHIGFDHLEVIEDMEYSLGFEEVFTPFTSVGVDIAQGKSIWVRASGIKNNNTEKSFTTSNLVECHGDVRSLLSKSNFETAVLTDYCFSYLFKNTMITTAPELPATTLAQSCYNSMFASCSNLTTAPELPATTLSQFCYSNMFIFCTKLTTAPELPATTLAQSCYSNMFHNCSNLTTAPELPATTLVTSCYSGMFGNCSNLTTAPELPATTLSQFCYSNMFSYCDKLTTVKCNARYVSDGTEITSKIDNNWLTGVSSTGKFYKNTEWSGPTERGVNTIPTGWTIVDWTDAV